MADAIKNCAGSEAEADPTYTEEIKIKPYPGSETNGGESSESGE